MEFHFADLYIENEHEVSLENYHCKVKHFCIGATRVRSKHLRSARGL